MEINSYKLQKNNHFRTNKTPDLDLEVKHS